jgi:hypothetical protein
MSEHNFGKSRGIARFKIPLATLEWKYVCTVEGVHVANFNILQRHYFIKAGQHLKNIGN